MEILQKKRLTILNCDYNTFILTRASGCDGDADLIGKRGCMDGKGRLMLFSILAAGAVLAADVDVTVNAGKQEGWVPYTMFGANFVIQKNQFDTNWVKVFTNCGMGVIRYPGGTATEKSFGNISAFDYLTNAPYMTDILLYCKTNPTVRPVFVVPTFRFTNDIPAGVAYATGYVSYVNTTLRDELGTPKVTRWEIGNEYYQELTPGQYAEVAAAQAKAIRAMDSNLTTIVHFFRTDMEATAEIGEVINSGTNAGCMTACNTHTYPGSKESITNTIAQQLLDSATALNFDSTEYVTEWNVAGSDTNDWWSGMSLAGRQMGIFKELVRGGVKYAAVWPMVWNPNSVDSALADWQGVMRPQGQAYQWLNQCAKAAWMVESIDNSSLLDSAAFKYMQTNRLSILVAGDKLPADSSVCVTVNGFVFSPSKVSAKRMVAPGGDVYSNGVAVVENVQPLVWGAATNKLTFSINVNSACEMVRIDLYP
jgi:hypothetical protein